MHYLILFPVMAALVPSEDIPQIEVTVHMVGLSDTVEVPETLETPGAWITDQSQAGHVRWSCLFQLTTLDQLSAKIHHGAQQPVVTGYSVRSGPGRPGSAQQRGSAIPSSRIPTMSMQSTGSILTVKPHVTNSGSVLIKVDLEDSRLVPRQTAEGDELLPGRTTATVQFSTTVSVKPDAPAVLRLQQTGSDSAPLNGTVLAVISARVLE